MSMISISNSKDQVLGSFKTDCLGKISLSANYLKNFAVRESLKNTPVTFDSSVKNAEEYSNVRSILNV